MDQEAALSLSAAAMAGRIAEGSLSASELIGHSLARAHFVQAKANCFCLILNDEAMRRAEAADAAVAAGRRVGPLHGVPVAIKDMTPTLGHLTTLGSFATGDWVPDASALIVRRLEAAGAIVIGKTTTPEFAHSSFTSSPRWGTTLNPWNLRRTSGGSSGGSAVAVATGCVPFAEGSDMGGSIRIPASFCGVVGLKPSHGRIPMTILPTAFDDLSHFGPIAQSVDDAILFLEAVAGASDEDFRSLPLPFQGDRARTTKLEGRRVAYSFDLGYYAVDQSVLTVMSAALEAIAESGVVVEPVDLSWTRELNDRWLDLWCVFMATLFGQHLRERPEMLDPAVAALMRRGFELDAVSIKRIEILRTRLWSDLVGVFASYDALLCPTCTMPAPLANLTDDDFMADTPDGRFAGLDMTCPFNLIAACPALSIPIGFSGEGLPIGMQIVGSRFEDEMILGLGRSIEKIVEPRRQSRPLPF